MAKTISITVLSGVSAGDIFRFDLEKTPVIKIGRLSECALVLQDPSVSRQHAKIELDSKGLFLSDLGSSTGTVHMGFTLKKGEEERRPLATDDEFKIGESIFRVEFDEDDFPSLKAKLNEPKPKVGPGGTATGMPAAKAVGSFKGRKKIIYLSLGAVLLLLLLFVMNDEDDSGLPAQKSTQVIRNLPREGVVGFYRGGKKNLTDRTHLDKAMFALPGADMVVDFELINEAPLKIFLDEALIAEIPPSTTWQYNQIIVRDLLLGKERILTIDNTDFPRANNQEGARNKVWGVKDLRMTPLAHDAATQVDSQLSGTLSVSEVLGSTPRSLYTTIRQYQTVVLGYLTELSRDAAVISIPRDSAFPESTELKDLVLSIINERKGVHTPEMLGRHLNALMEIDSRLEAELWRLVNQAIREATVAAKAKNNIRAYDVLTSVMQMFPDEADFRWTLANRMFNDDDIVPKKVRKNPNKFRKKSAFD